MKEKALKQEHKTRNEEVLNLWRQFTTTAMVLCSCAVALVAEIYGLRRTVKI